mmetsp:Transcript_11269/g.28519  ORF Transcript_11269/g.28519 Transcript_11269/m.28519 type:complete len:311 (-) Transcript_11269:856-1788(-)
MPFESRNSTNTLTVFLDKADLVSVVRSPVLLAAFLAATFFFGAAFFGASSVKKGVDAVGSSSATVFLAAAFFDCAFLGAVFFFGATASAVGKSSFVGEAFFFGAAAFFFASSSDLFAASSAIFLASAASFFFASAASTASFFNCSNLDFPAAAFLAESFLPFSSSLTRLLHSSRALFSSPSRVLTLESFSFNFCFSNSISRFRFKEVSAAWSLALLISNSFLVNFVFASASWLSRSNPVASSVFIRLWSVPNSSVRPPIFAVVASISTLEAALIPFFGLLLFAIPTIKNVTPAATAAQVLVVSGRFSMNC